VEGCECSVSRSGHFTLWERLYKRLSAVQEPA